MASTVTILGRWVNQNGSILIVDRSDGANFFGTFQSKKGRAARDRDYPVSGVQNGEVLAFSVDFNDPRENLQAISNFSGRLTRDSDGNEVIHSLWVLARQFEDEARSKPTQAWNSFLVNSDTFTRIGVDEH